MSISAAYATAEQYRFVTGGTDSSKDTDILIDLKAISRYIDGKMHRFFTCDADAVTRIYVPAETSSTLWVNDLSAAPTSIKVDDDGDGDFDDETALASTDYELLPFNADKGPEPSPWMQIALGPWGTRDSFRAGVRVQVIACFGWPAVPEAIQRATIHLTAILRLETPRATRRIPELGEAIETSWEAQKIIRQLVSQYRRFI